MLNEYEIAVRGPDLQRLGLVDQILSLDCEEHLLGLGSWVLRAPFIGDVSKFLTTRGTGIVVRHEGRVVFSGPMRSWEREVNAENGTDEIIIEGWDDMAALHVRVVPPVAATPFTFPFAVSHYTKTTGTVASTVIWQSINDHVGPGAEVSRRYPGLVMATDPVQGPPLAEPKTERFSNLLLNIAEYANPIDMTVLVRQVNAQLICYVRTARDRTNVELSPRAETVQSWRMRSAAPEVTAAWAGGTGEGTDRAMRYDDDPPPADWPLRVETFLDHRNVHDTAELDRKITEALKGGAATTSLEITGVEADGARYGVDFDLGDKVTVNLDGTDSVQKVSWASLHLDSEGRTSRTIGIGPEAATGAAALFRLIRRLGAQIKNSGAT